MYGMPTTKKRLNLSLTGEMEEVLSVLAERDDMPTARKAIELIEVALEIEEDALWGEIAEKRETNVSTYLSHETAWK
jgi:hypothetical protein